MQFKLLLLPIILIGGVIYFININNSYPFYFLFDMDQIVTLDTLLIGSGYFPEHLYHPTFGVYLVALFVAKIGFLINQLPANNIDSFINSINPYFLNAQFTNLYRAIAPVICILICLLWFLIFNNSRPKYVFTNLLFLICIIFSSSLVWQSALIKSEQFCILFWLVAIYFLNLSKNNLNYKKNILLILSGLFIGLCLLTKIQSFLLLTIYYLYFIYQYIDEFKFKNFKNNIIFISFPFFIFLILFLIAIYTNIESTVTGASSYSINIIGTFYCFILLLPLGFELLFKFFKNNRSEAVFLFTLLNYGFLSSFLLHFFMYEKLSTSFIYLIYDFKIIFLRNIDYSYQIKPNLFDYISIFKLSILNQPILFLGSFFSFLILLIDVFVNKVSNIKFVLLVLIFGVTLLNIIIINRNWGSDELWVETSLYFLLFLFYVNSRFLDKSFTNKVITICMLIFLVFLLFENISLSKLMRQNLNASISQYGWNLNSSLSAVYGGNQPLIIKSYTKTMPEKTINTASSMAEKYKDFIFISNFTFPNRKIDATEISFLYPDLPISKNNKNERLTEVPKELRLSLLLDPSASYIKEDFLWSKSGVIDTPLTADKQVRIIKKSTQNELPILVRKDLKVYLFSYDFLNLNSSISKCDYQVKVNENKFNCYQILSSTILDIPINFNKFFFIITRAQDINE